MNAVPILVPVALLLFTVAVVIEEEGAYRYVDKRLVQIQETVRKVEAANEHLRAADAELERSDARLKAAADGLDAVNHELRSANSRLLAVNDRLVADLKDLMEACSLATGTPIPIAK